MGQHERSEHSRQSKRGKWVLVGFLVVAAYFLWTKHQAHLAGALPYLLLLACPLMHLFHHGHGRGAHEHATDHARRRIHRRPGEES